MNNGNLSFWKKVGVVFGAIGSILIVMISWQSLSFLPRWAWYDEVLDVKMDSMERVANVQSFAEGTRLIVLGQEWERLDLKIRKLEAKESLTEAEQQLLTKLKLRMLRVNQQLERLGASRDDL
jgi:hypothetical protein